MRPFRALGLITVGAIAGFAAAGVLVKRSFPSFGDETSDEVALVAIFDGIELKSRATAFRGGSMLSWFGGIAVDLREAELAPDARLRVVTALGGIAIRLPAGTRVESNAAVIGGGVAVNAPKPETDDAPRLVVDGFALLGGIAVKADEPDAAEPAA
jgi:hypothetical protein